MMPREPTGLPFTRRRLLLFRQTHRLLEYRPTAIMIEVNPLSHRIPRAPAIPLGEFVLSVKDVPDLRSIRAAKEAVMPGTEIAIRATQHGPGLDPAPRIRRLFARPCQEAKGVVLRAAEAGAEGDVGFVGVVHGMGPLVDREAVTLPGVGGR